MKTFFLFSILIFSLTSCISRQAHLQLQNDYQALNKDKVQLTKLAADSQRDLQKLKDEYTALKIYSQDNIDELQAKIIRLEKELRHAQLQLQYQQKAKDSLMVQSPDNL